MRLLPLLLILSCDAADPQYRYGTVFADLAFELFTTDMGIHPDTSILEDPNNPFDRGLTGDTKWDVLDDSPIGGFYAFGSSLVAIPTGEHQFYTAKQLHSIYDQRLADPQDIAMIREMAIRGYQSTLDNFSGAVTYDTTGRFAFEVGPLAIDGIHALGGDVLNGWVQVTTTDGGTTVVRAQ